MNSLSWMIYFADVVGGALVILGLLMFATAIFAGGATAIGFFKREENRSYGAEDRDFQAGQRLFVAGRGKLWIPLVLAIAVVFTPSRETIYAIAASEMGETALNSETGGKAVQALNAWLDRQIAGEPETNQ